MKKNLTALLCLLLLSCGKENLYEFNDISGYRDFIYRVELYPANEEEAVEFRINQIQTNGYNEIRERRSFTYTEKTTNFLTFESAVKNYKLTGVDIFPEKNIKKIRIFLYETGISVGPHPYTYNFTMYRSIDNPEPVSIRYNFETNEEFISPIEEN